MDEFHDMVCEAETPSEALFACSVDACGRRVVVGKTWPGLTVIDQGDFRARHSGSIGGLTVSAANASQT